MNNSINIGDFVILNSNSKLHHEVGKYKEVFLTPGYCDRNEQGADFICVVAPCQMSRRFKKWFNYKTYKYEYNVVKNFIGLHIKSTKTGKIYIVDNDCCSGYAPNSEEYKRALMMSHVDALITEQLIEDMDNARMEVWDMQY